MTSDVSRLKAPFVQNDGARLSDVLAVRPSQAVEAIAPLQSEPGAIYERAAEQFDGLVSTLALRGVRSTVLDPDPSRGAGVMIADLAVVLAGGAILMRPTDARRWPELERVERALTAAGVPLIGRIEPPGLLDGGDVLLGDGVAYVGVTYDRKDTIGLPRARRGNEFGRRQFAAIASEAGVRVRETPVASDVRRLRAVASFVDTKTVLVASDRVDRTVFGDAEIVETPAGEEYGAGVLALGGRRVLANVRFRELFSVLKRARVNADAIDLWEFGKFGATPSMLALALKRA